ncbi:MAG: hypothetical protein ACYC9L_03220 [Sulfuricaulis sp.]
MSNNVPEKIPNRLLIAFPDDGSPPIAMATKDHCAFDAHLRREGFDPDHCMIGQAELAAAEFVVSWDRTVRIEA